MKSIFRSLRLYALFIFSAVLDTAVVDRGRNIVSVSRDGSACLWDVGKQKTLMSLQDIGGQINCCSIEVTENSIDLGAGNVDRSEFTTFVWWSGKSAELSQMEYSKINITYLSQFLFLV